MLKKILLMIFLFIISLSNLISEELDSVEVQPKPKYIGFTLGAGFPELVYLGINLRLTKGLYLNYKMGFSPKGTYNNFYFFDYYDLAHTGEIVKYFNTENYLKKYFESGTFNISFSYTLMIHPNPLFELNNYNYYNLKLGNDFYLLENLVLQLGVGIGIGEILNYDNKRINFIHLVGKINFLFWYF
jgi:hypothetical protein